MPASSPNRVMRTNHQGRERDRACIRDPRADRVQRPNPTVRDQPEQKWRQYSLTAFSSTAPIFQPLFAPARSTKARDVPPPMPRIVRPGGRQHRLELATQRQTAALREVHRNASVHTDAANPPAPGSPHIAHIGPTFSASPKKSQGKIARGGPRDRNAFPSATPPPRCVC